MGRRCTRTEPYPCCGLCDADVLRAPEVQHAVQNIGGDGYLGRLSPLRLRAQPAANNAFPARDIGLHQSTPVVSRRPLPAHAAALGDTSQMPVALRRRGPGRLARHRIRARWHDHGRSGMAGSDLGVDIVAVVGTIVEGGPNSGHSAATECSLRAPMIARPKTSKALSCMIFEWHTF